MNFPSEIIVIPAIVIGLPWLILHYVTRWKTAATLTTDDERTLGDVHELARRLEDRLDTVERLVACGVPFRIDPRRAHVFDAGTGLRL